MATNEHSNAKVIIIGAGPAGMTASLYLAKRGIPSLLLEKAAHPRAKACADVVTGQAIRVLHDLDPALPLDGGLISKYLPIKGTLLYPPNGKHLDIAFLPLKKLEHLPTCIAMPRADFDLWLAQKVKASPLVELRENTVVHHFQQDGTTREWTVFDKGNKALAQAKLLILATGSNSPLAMLLGKQKREDRHYAVGIRGYFKGVSNPDYPQHCELFLHPKLFPGGFYIAPFNNGTSNVNIVMRSDAVKARKLNLNALFWEMIEANPILQKRFKNAEQLSKLEGSTLHLGTKHRPLSGDGYLLAGDAGGLIDLISANGIPQAMISGKFAAEQAAIALETGDFSLASLSEYDQKVYAKIKNDMYLGRLLSPYLGKKAVQSLILRSLNFLASQRGTQTQLRELLYSENVRMTLSNPMFYLRLVKG